MLIYFVNKNFLCNFAKKIKNNIDMDSKVEEYLSSLDKDACLSIIKYGLRGSNAPSAVTVEDIFNVIGCLYIEMQ